MGKNGNGNGVARSGSGGLSIVADAAPQVARQLAAEAKVEAREYLRPHHRVFLEGLVAGVTERERTSMNLYPRVAGMLDAEADLADAFRELFRDLRVGGQDDLRRAVELMRSAEDVTGEQADQQWLVYGRRRIKSDPKFRSWAREVLFGEREVQTQDAILQAQLPSGTTNGGGHDLGHGMGKTNGS